MTEHTYAIGDIHGQLDLLKRLLKKIGADKQALFVFLGDYIDRGMHSKAVIDFLIGFSKTHWCIFLKGNHEDLLEKSLPYINNESDQSDQFVLWMINGGDATCKSYGGCATIYPTHQAFFQKLESYYETDQYIFVHGGLKPGIDLKKQKYMDLLWIRDEFILTPTGLYPDKIVIYGHTYVDVCRSPFPDKIGLDTGAAWGGLLSAIQLPEKKMIQVSL